MGFFSVILDIFFPPKCVFCGKILSKDDEDWCDGCTESLPFADNCGKQDGEVFDFCVSPLYYVGVVRRSLLRYKFGGASQYADAYGRLLAECISDCPDMNYDIISWIPLSQKRERKRGYDQAMLLAMATALHLDSVAIETLSKPHDVRAQSELGDRAERSSNIKGAYAVTDSELIAGKRILLIDDIVTTCSTLDECASVLISAGAGSVVCAALAGGSN